MLSWDILVNNAIVQGFLPHLRETGMRPEVIIPDCLSKISGEYRSIAEEQDENHHIITPETSEERIRLIDEPPTVLSIWYLHRYHGAQKDFNAQKQAYFQRIADMNLRKKSHA